MHGLEGWYPFLMGVAAVFNPCGIALLPATLAWMGGTVPAGPGMLHPAGRGAAVGLAMAAGFTGVVALLGLVVHLAGVVLAPVLRPLLVGLGLAVLAGGMLVAGGRLHLPVSRWTGADRLPSGQAGSLWAAFLAGVVYATAALGCTLPLFVAVLLPALTAGWTAFLALVGSFGAGAALVLTAAGVAVLFAREALAGAVARLGPRLNLWLGLIIGAAGAYLTYYWLWGPGRLLA
ncbi:Cytochrome c biogenesis protein CcdA [Candidatus Hydrogenisulfobacillus filiaventi]|uniref:Cytochrome c biogenesis protein CcdA n=1 Tax=Candidatus Hydrogenisulfobacillus filiaventi TaxID=2707344 RepID=A0A6F8ZHL6_9FIRM|nr:hypothetical protein [Bacillota bacterium]CAB1128949.1 Cytochrome c biogenesis protein CcdA [Candidatus Hydrogenisulfobacillus filiaventi]